MDLQGLSLAPYLRACVAGDWIVFLDLRHDRYWALPCGLSCAELEARLARRGLLGARDVQPSAHGASAALSGDALSMLRAGMWANHIVKHGKLEAAFNWIERRKRAQAPIAPDGAEAEAYAAFERLRPWLPWPYVCLFNSLCLIRFLFARGCQADLVIGVRARPFVAHAWVEARGIILDAGSEDCASFAEIARV